MNEADLDKKFRCEGAECAGTIKGMRWYVKGIKTAQKSMRYSRLDYEFFYDVGMHHKPYLQREQQLFWKAIDCYKISAEFGNELAMVNYGLYLFYFEKERRQQAVELFLKASNAGLATADYALYCIFKDGYDIMPPDTEKAERFVEQCEQRCRDSVRQRVLMGDTNRDGYMISKMRFHEWSCGYTFVGVYDLPGYYPHSWM